MKGCSKYKWYQMMSIMVLAAVFTAGCATTEKRDMASQLAVAKEAIDDAVSAGAPELASVELKTARDTLNDAEKAAMDHEYKRAIRFGESAQTTAQLASAKARAVKAQRAADALEKGDRVLQDEMNRKLQ